MRRTIPLGILVTCLAAASAGAASGGRTVERSYEPVEVSATFPQGSIRSSSSVTFRTRPQESLVTVAITDDSGLKVPARVTQDADGDGEADTTHEFCGSTADAVAIEPGVAVKVVRLEGSCSELRDPTQYGAWTTGTVTATFSR